MTNSFVQMNVISSILPGERSSWPNGEPSIGETDLFRISEHPRRPAIVRIGVTINGTFHYWDLSPDAQEKMMEAIDDPPPSNAPVWIAAREHSRELGGRDIDFGGDKEPTAPEL